MSGPIAEVVEAYNGRSAITEKQRLQPVPFHGRYRLTRKKNART